MNLEILNYYFIKDYIKKLNINYEIENKHLFDYSNFLSINNYYKINSLRRDKVKIGDLIKDNFNEFYANLLVGVKANKSIENLYFLYSIYSNKLIKEYFDSYVNTFKPYKMRYQEALNIIDSYIYYKNTNEILTNKTIYKKFKYFNLSDDIKRIVVSSTVMSCNQSGVYPYFLRCYKKRNVFYRFYNTKFLRIRIFIKDLFIKNKKYKKYYYKKKYNINLFLNEDKKTFIVNNKEYNYNFNELLDHISNELDIIRKYIDEYLTDSKEENIKKYLNIRTDKKM